MSKEIKLKELEDKAWDLSLLVDKVNYITKDIKYNDVPSSIYLKVQSLAEENGISEQEVEWKIDEVRSAVNALESAIYDLVEPFEDAKRDAEWKKDDLEMEIEDEKYALSC